MARQCELAADEVAGYGVLKRLGVQGREYPLAGGVQQQPVQGLPRTQPVRAAVAGSQEHGGGGRRRPAGREAGDASAEVEVTLRQPPRRTPGATGERGAGDAIPCRAGCNPGPAPYLGPGARAEIATA